MQDDAKYRRLGHDEEGLTRESTVSVETVDSGENPGDLSGYIFWFRSLVSS